MKVLLAALLMLPLLCQAIERDPNGRIHRSARAVAEFRHQTICPSTGKRTRKCPGYVVDHVDPLCDGGADNPLNMQYQTIAEGKAKDKIERRMCRR